MRDHGIIYPESESPPMNIINSNVSQTNDPLIRIELQHPYGQFNIKNVSVSNAHDPPKAMNLNNVSRYLEFPAKYNSLYTIQVPKIIDMAENETRAVFQRWSDGSTF